MLSLTITVPVMQCCLAILLMSKPDSGIYSKCYLSQLGLSIAYALLMKHDEHRKAQHH